MSTTSTTVLLHVTNGSEAGAELSDALQIAGFDVRLALWKDAVRACCEEEPDLILLQLPIGPEPLSSSRNGRHISRSSEADRLLEQIRDLHKNSPVPIVQIEGPPPQPALPAPLEVGSGSHRNGQAHSGPDGFVASSRDLAELFPLLHSLLRMHDAEKELQDRSGQWQKLFDLLSEGVCLVDPSGNILQCNRAMAEVLEEDASRLIGQSFEQRVRQLDETSIGSLLPRLQTLHSKEIRKRQIGERYFTKTVDPIRNEDGALQGAALVLLDITDYKNEKARAEQAEAELRDKGEQIRQLEAEVERLGRLTGNGSTHVVSKLYGHHPLREQLPELFDQIVELYGNLLERAVERRHYDLCSALSEDLRDLAERLGHYRCGPKDVIDVHKETLSRKQSPKPTKRFVGYINEGRLLVLELMGYLGNHYRLLALGAPRERGKRTGASVSLERGTSSPGSLRSGNGVSRSTRSQPSPGADETEESTTTG